MWAKKCVIDQSPSKKKYPGYPTGLREKSLSFRPTKCSHGKVPFSGSRNIKSKQNVLIKSKLFISFYNQIFLFSA